jgi:hypothetical protein
MFELQIHVLEWARTSHADLFLSKASILSHVLHLTTMQIFRAAMKIVSRLI